MEGEKVIRYAHGRWSHTGRTVCPPEAQCRGGTCTYTHSSTTSGQYFKACLRLHSRAAVLNPLPQRLQVEAATADAVVHHSQLTGHQLTHIINTC